MEKEQNWSVIRSFFLNGKNHEEINMKFYAIYKDQAFR